MRLKLNFKSSGLLAVLLISSSSSITTVTATSTTPPPSSLPTIPTRSSSSFSSSSCGTGIGTKMKCYEVPQFIALQSAAASFKSDDKLHLRHLCSDSSRCAGLVAVHTSGGIGERKIILDYSRQQVTGETMELLFDLADKVGLTELRSYMRCGLKINATERRSVLHHALRMPRTYDYTHHPYGMQIMDDVHAVRTRIEEFTNKIRSGSWKGYTGKTLKHTVCIGIGGSQLGPEFVHEALRADQQASLAAEGRTLRFLANVDPVDFHLCTRDLDPAETLVVIISKTFETVETMLNARAARKWLIDGLRGSNESDNKNDNNEDKNDDAPDDESIEKDIIMRHVVAVSASPPNCEDFGIHPDNVFGFWDWVGGRFSVTSAVGVLPLSLQYSYDIMSAFLDGAHDIDEHFFNAPLRENIPVLLGLIGIWNSTFMGYATRALLPYSQALRRLPAHIQQLDMESNGKRVAMDGTPLPFYAGEINFGEPGTNGQHSFYQLLHQGRVVPADFIGFCESQRPVELDGEQVSNHDELMSNFFAQPDALAYGKTFNDLIQEGVPEELRQHKVFTGNRPSSSLLLTRLDAFAVGQILAIYEHRTAVQGFVWGINSFDQWGVELGKVLAKQVRAQLKLSRVSGASVQGFNSSTSSLLEAYLSHRKK